MSKKFINKYRKMGAPIKAAFWFAIMSVFQKGIVFLATPIYTRTLTTEEYGYYSLFATWLGVLTIVATLNLNAGGFINAMLKYPNKKNQFITSMIGLGNAFTIIIFSIIFMFYKTFTSLIGLDKKTLFCIFLILMFYPAFQCWSSAQRFDYKYKLMFAITMVQSLSIPILSVVFALNIPHRKYAMILGTTIVETIIGLCFYIFFISNGKTYYKKEYWGFSLKFNLPLIPHYLSLVILGQSDRIMINQYCGKSYVGIYSLGYSISQIVSIFVVAISSSYAPWTFKNIKGKNYKKIGDYTNYILLLVGLIVLLSVLIGPELIGILSTSEYSEAKWIMAPVMLSCFFTMIYSFFANIEFYFEKSLYVMVASTIAAISNIVLNVIFIPRFGYLAAGYTTLFSYIILTIMHYAYMKYICNKEGIGQIYSIRFVLAISVGVFLMAFLCMALYPFFVIRYVLLLGLLIILFIKRDVIYTILQGIR